MLALDTCFGCCSVAVFDAAAHRVVAERHAFMERGHAEVLAPMVQAALTEAGLDAKMLGRIAVTTGPGTFTGLRIGLSFAQGFAMAHAIPLVGLSSLIATAAPLFGRGSSVTVVHKAGATGQLYVQHFSASGAADSEILLQSAGEIVVAPDAKVIGTGAAVLAEHAGKIVGHEQRNDLPIAADFAAFASALPIDPQSAAKPVYVRAADAKPQRQSLSIARVGAEAAELLASMHAASFSAGWGRDAIAEMLMIPGTLALVVQADADPAAMVIARAIADEAEILTLATVPRFQRRGIARHVLQRLEIYLQSLAVKTIHLEAASDNAAALALYEGSGYVRTGLRKAYYASGAAAVVMRRIL